MLYIWKNIEIADYWKVKCGIYIGKSRYQAEQVLSYLKRNYPTYNNHHISGSGAWDDLYWIFMSKEIRIYNMRTKQEFICEADYNCCLVFCLFFIFSPLMYVFISPTHTIAHRPVRVFITSTFFLHNGG